MKRYFAVAAVFALFTSCALSDDLPNAAATNNSEKIAWKRHLTLSAPDPVYTLSLDIGRLTSMKDGTTETNYIPREYVFNALGVAECNHDFENPKFGDYDVVAKNIQITFTPSYCDVIRVANESSAFFGQEFVPDMMFSNNVEFVRGDVRLVDETADEKTFELSVEYYGRIDWRRRSVGNPAMITGRFHAETQPRTITWQHVIRKYED